MKLENLQKSQQSLDATMESLWQSYWSGEIPIDRSIDLKVEDLYEAIPGGARPHSTR